MHVSVIVFFVCLYASRQKRKIGHNDVHYKKEVSKLTADTTGMYDAKSEYVAIGNTAALHVTTGMCTYMHCVINYGLVVVSSYVARAHKG